MNNDKKNAPNANDDMNADITPEERSLLDQGIENGMLGDNENLYQSTLDNTDDDGELLNVEDSDQSLDGGYVDIPGSELDDDNEMIGEEDEENNGYSQADTE